jgi:cytochrome b6-f complex iron-sulfur subunit
MSPAVIIAIAIGAVLVLGAIVLATAARRTDVRGAGALSRETVKRDRDADIDLPVAATGKEVELAARSTEVAKVTSAAPAVWSPPDPEAVAVSRRQFLNRANASLMGAGLTTFAAASFVAFLWPSGASGFGGKVAVGKFDDIISSIRTSGGFFYSSTARSWITQYPSDGLPKARQVAAYNPVIAGMEDGLVALYQKCPHLGCRVPECKTSQWFECPCHGSQYNRVGEKKAGPAPRGMDHFTLTVGPTGDVIVDTGTPHPGAPIGTNTTGQEAEGPHCITGGGGH